MAQRRGLASSVEGCVRVIACLVLIGVLRLLGFSIVVSLIATVIVVSLVSGIFYLVRWIREYRLVTRLAAELPPYPEELTRLACIGEPQIWMGAPPFEDVPFEPTIVRGGFGVWPTAGWAATATVVIFGCLLFVALMILVRFRFAQLLPGITIACITISIVAAQATRAFLWPIYLRLVPGRLDVMHFSAFGRKVKKLERVPLRDAKILVNLIDRYAIIDAADKRHELSLLLMPEFKSFAHTLFLAAISTYTPPPLPDDHLLG